MEWENRGLFEAKSKAAQGNGESGEPEPEPESPAAMVLVPIAMPEGERSSGWWSQLVRGSGDRKIERQAAVEVWPGSALCSIIHHG
jgi:hypothetical protein